jgi:hypothetical protein
VIERHAIAIIIVGKHGDRFYMCRGESVRPNGQRRVCTTEHLAGARLYRQSRMLERMLETLAAEGYAFRTVEILAVI